ncbi:hypothetical protein [Streptomyces poonensis]|uniref:Uncharacterized protein n=1 Tax=Streptomyces poonensis TaxID=68255 RepID=A0A918UPY2_9ACTN|nr:hypothetical protein [Streptomyces poonensis]GGZ26107.1 hypothetical protein GCM10010365_53010 [Streptomyces poonensis]GLJ89035.1 hypothetical protein GCM10017589_16350 [Streptomyces poonensis]
MRATTVRADGRRPQPAGEPARDSADRPAAVRSGPWLLRGHDGRLILYALAGRAVLRWTERRSGGPEWDGPDVLPAEDLSHLTVVQGRNRYAHLLGRRVRPAQDGSLTVDLMYAIQYQAGRPLSEWRSIGNPHAKRERTALMGAPAATVADDGTLYVFAPTAEGRISLRREDERGRWAPWRDLQVTAALDTPAAAATSTGHVELLAPARGGALTWFQPEPGKALERGPDLGVVPLPGSATAVETSGGRLTYYLTDVRGDMVAVRAGEWPVPLGAKPGDGRHAALTTTLDGYACTVLAHRGAEGRVMLGVCGAEDERSGVWWTDTGTDCLGDPVLALDGHGRVVVLAVAADGSLTLARQEEGPGLTLSAWSRI